MTTRLCRLGVANFTDLGEVVGIGDDLPDFHSVVHLDRHHWGLVGDLPVCYRRREVGPEVLAHAESSAAILQE